MVAAAPKQCSRELALKLLKILIESTVVSAIVAHRIHEEGTSDALEQTVISSTKMQKMGISQLFFVMTGDPITPDELDQALFLE